MTQNANVNGNAKVIICPILSNGTPIGTDEKPAVITVDTGNLSKSIGDILEKNKAGTEFRILGATVKIPTGSFSGQFNAIVKKLVELSFAGCDVKDEPKVKDGKAVVLGLKGKLHFINPTMAQVFDALKIRTSNYTSSVKWEKNKVRMIEENKVLIAQTGLYKDANKMVKDGFNHSQILKALQAEKKDVKLLN